MPVHRIARKEDLDNKVGALERKGETVVQVIDWSNGWIVVTSKSPKVETR